MSIARVTHFTVRSWRAPIALAALLTVLALAGPDGMHALRYQRSDIMAGEAWRLVTAHLVHDGLAHLAWNLAGLALVTWLFAAEYGTKQWLLVLAASTVAIDAGFLIFMPELDWYVGFSGVLHGAMAAGLYAWLVRTRDTVTWIVAVIFAAKLAWEHIVGPLPFTAASLDLPVIYQAHSYGAIGGLAAAAWLESRRQTATSPL